MAASSNQVAKFCVIVELINIEARMKLIQKQKFCIENSCGMLWQWHLPKLREIMGGGIRARMEYTRTEIYVEMWSGFFQNYAR